MHYRLVPFGRACAGLGAAFVLASCSGGTSSGGTNNGSTGPTAPTATLAANPSTVASGGSSTLVWSSTNATSCGASSTPTHGSWNGGKATSGNQTLSTLTATATYTLTCSGSGGNTSQSATVTVTTVTPPPPGASGDNLAETAALMQPGEWRELVTNNLEPTLNNPTCGATGSVFPYSEDAVWDPVSRRVFFIGSDHVYCDTMTQRFIAYSEATNSWATLPNPSWFSNGVHHGYDHSAIDTTNGIYYHFPFAGYGNRPLHRYDTGTDTWLADTPVAPNTTCCAGVEYFPEFVGTNTSVATGGVVMAGGRDVHVYRAATNSWVGPLNTTPLSDTGDYHNVAEYNPVHKVVIFGGGNGSGALYKLAANGTVTPLTAAPFQLRVIESIVTVDPVSGDYLVFGRNGEFYKFDVTDGPAGAWTQQPGPPPFSTPQFQSGSSAVDLTVAAPISTYGVVMFVKHIPGNASQTKVYLYKHR
jgi:hypothetical protein